MSDANRSQLAFVKEVTIGTYPGTAAMTKLRFTDDSLNYNIEGINSAEIRSDRQPTDLIQTGRESTGGFNFELSYGTFDSLLRGALFADTDWVGVGSGATTSITSGATGSDLEFTLNATNNTITLGSSVNHAIVAGQVIRLLGSAADDDVHFVSAVSGQTLTVGSITTSEVLDESDAATIDGSYLRNGSTEHGYTVERYLADKGDYFNFKGMMVNTLTITATASSILTGSFDFLGQEALAATTSISGAAYSEAPTNDVMNAVSNVGDILEGSTLTALSGQYIQELSFTINNNLRGIQAIGYAYNVDVGAGNLDVSGTLNLYYQDLTIYNKYIASTISGISFRVEDESTEGTGNAYVFTFPRVRFASDTINVPGQNTDVMENMTWAGLRHGTYDYTVQVCRFAAP